MTVTPVEVTWRWRARLVLAVAIAGFVALGVWAFPDPRIQAKILAGVVWFVALGCAALLVESFVFRLAADERGFRVRSVKGTYEASWSDVLAVRLVHTSEDSRHIIHTHTPDPADALHLVLETRSKTWNLNRWMHDVGRLMNLVYDLGLVSHEASA